MTENPRRIVRLHDDISDFRWPCDRVSPLLTLAAVFTGVAGPDQLRELLWSKDAMITIMVN